MSRLIGINFPFKPVEEGVEADVIQCKTSRFKYPKNTIVGSLNSAFVLLNEEKVVFITHNLHDLTICELDLHTLETLTQKNLCFSQKITSTVCYHEGYCIIATVYGELFVVGVNSDELYQTKFSSGVLEIKSTPYGFIVVDSQGCVTQCSISDEKIRKTSLQTKKCGKEIYSLSVNGMHWSCFGANGVLFTGSFVEHSRPTLTEFDAPLADCLAVYEDTVYYHYNHFLHSLSGDVEQSLLFPKEVKSMLCIDDLLFILTVNDGLYISHVYDGHMTDPHAVANTEEALAMHEHEKNIVLSTHSGCVLLLPTKSKAVLKMTSREYEIPIAQYNFLLQSEELDDTWGVEWTTKLGMLQIISESRFVGSQLLSVVLDALSDLPLIDNPPALLDDFDFCLWGVITLMAHHRHSVICDILGTYKRTLESPPLFSLFVEAMVRSGTPVDDSVAVHLLLFDEEHPHVALFEEWNGTDLKTHIGSFVHLTPCLLPIVLNFAVDDLIVIFMKIVDAGHPTTAFTLLNRLAKCEYGVQEELIGVLLDKYIELDRVHEVSHLPWMGSHIKTVIELLHGSQNTSASCAFDFCITRKLWREASEVAPGDDEKSLALRMMI
ncbi:hypothetical protein PCE1_003585 [Barthelona sp. PCE]